MIHSDYAKKSYTISGEKVRKNKEKFTETQERAMQRGVVYGKFIITGNLIKFYHGKKLEFTRWKKFFTETNEIF